MPRSQSNMGIGIHKKQGMFDAKNIDDSITGLNEPYEKIDKDEKNGPMAIERFTPVIRKTSLIK